jgi:hypothetical protein
MDYILNPTNEEQISPGSINNSIEQINETINPEGDFNLLNNIFIFNKKDIETQKIIDKNAKGNNKEEKELNNLIYDEKKIIELTEVINNKSAISSIINDKKKENLGKKQKKKCGRKRLSNKEIKEHNKFSDDNIRRKCKHLVLKNTLIFINEKIFIMYGGKIGEGILKKELKIPNQIQKSDASVGYNQDFLNKKLGEIFSESISGRYANLPSIHNKKLIPGAVYRLTDYCGMVPSARIHLSNAGHQFDLLLLALAEDTLSEDAKACAHHFDNPESPEALYFLETNFGAWKVKYCLDPDPNRFDWVEQKSIYLSGSNSGLYSYDGVNPTNNMHRWVA